MNQPASATCYHVFETAAGHAAIGWNDRGISSFRLPSHSAREASWSLLRRLPDATIADPPPPVRAIVDAACRYFAGERVDFSEVPIDLGEQEPFFARVYDTVRQLGWGETTTYGAVAKGLGAGPEFARDVGQAMASNPIPLIVPCHRVTAAGGKIGGFSAPGGSFSKARMLELEGVSIAVDAGKKPETKPPEQPGFDF